MWSNHDIFILESALFLAINIFDKKLEISRIAESDVDLLEKFECLSFFIRSHAAPGQTNWWIFSDYCSDRRFYFVRDEGATLYYGLRIAFRRQIAEYFGEWSERKSIRTTEMEENVEWSRIARILNIDCIDQRR